MHTVHGNYTEDMDTITISVLHFFCRIYYPAGCQDSLQYSIYSGRSGQILKVYYLKKPVALLMYIQYHIKKNIAV